MRYLIDFLISCILNERRQVLKDFVNLLYMYGSIEKRSNL
jgi:hypothetical protein